MCPYKVGQSFELYLTVKFRLLIFESFRTHPTYNGQWIDMVCYTWFHAVCMFYKSGNIPMKEEPVLSQKGGCKLGWWSYAGYCYKDFGFDPGFGTDGHMTYNQGNNSCSADWAGARMAILPSIQHNHLLAALLGPGRYHNDIWIGVYNWAHSDYYFSLDNTQKLNYDNWATVLSLNSFYAKN